jgi:superfamily II DNA or RNA helicase
MTAAMRGVYIAWHPWLDLVARESGYKQIVKVGQSSRLEDRLHDSAYTTCWGAGWRYLNTFEIADAAGDEQLVLEQATLTFISNRRIDGRELLGLDDMFDYGDLLRTIGEMAKVVGVEFCLRKLPVYERRAQPGRAPAMLDQAPADQAPAIQAPAIQAPAIQAPAIQAPAIQAPAAQAPADQAPAAQAPTTQAPAIDESFVVVPSAPLEERKYQVDAFEMGCAELDRIGRTTLVMACRCGKTRVAQMVMDRYMRPVSSAQPPAASTQPRALFMVPTLELLWQTASKLASYWGDAVDFVLVGSSTGIRAGLRMTTDVEAVKTAVAEQTRPLIVVSTYDSSVTAVKGAAPFAITVFDECHKVCGTRANTKGELRPSNYVLLGTTQGTTGRRLFMTATPEMSGEVSMRDQSLFGCVAYRYNIRQGIDAGYVNPFEVQLVAASCDVFNSAKSAQGPYDKPRWRRVARSLASVFRRELSEGLPAFEAASPLDYMAAQVCAAYEHLRAGESDEGQWPRSKLLVFCRTIDGSRELMGRVQHVFECSAVEGDPPPPRLYAISSKTQRAEQTTIKDRLAEPGHAAIVFNCKQFQEGVEFAPLNAVFFSTPRHSMRDIIQSMCRSLTRVNRGDGSSLKPTSVVYIPVPASSSPESAEQQSPELGRFETLLPFAEALYSEDQRFYDYLIDPAANRYPIGWVGVYGGAAQLLQQLRRAIRYGCGASRGADRLAAKENIPWECAMSELARIIRVCRRYPKKKGDGLYLGTDPGKMPGGSGRPDADEVANLSSWYHNWVVPNYRQFISGQDSALEPHQIADLERLEGWSTRGGGGEVGKNNKIVSYPLRECLSTLRKILADNSGTLPYISIGSCEWNGIDATPQELLSGYARLISQRDSASSRGANRGFNIGAAEADELDQVFGKWGLRWRKERYFTNNELDTAIAAGHAVSRAEATQHLRSQGKHGYLLTDSDGAYCGPLTVLQEANNRLKAERERHTKAVKLALKEDRPAPGIDPVVASGWPGPWSKYSRQDHVGVARPVKC